MKKIIIAGAILMLPLSVGYAASVDYFLEIDGVKGETKNTTSSATTQLQVTAVTSGDSTKTDDSTRDGSEDSSTGSASGSTREDKTNSTEDPQEASADYFLKIDGVEGESTESKESTSTSKHKGKVEYGWKVEEGEALQGVEPDEIDFASSSESLMTSFGVLLGGSDSDNDGEETEEEKGQAETHRSEVAKIVLQTLQEDEVPMETLSLNYEEIKASLKHEIKLFGFIPVSTTATVKIDNENKIKVRFPWWAFLASGKDSDNLGQSIFNAISSILETKHDTIKNSISNIR